MTQRTTSCCVDSRQWHLTTPVYDTRAQIMAQIDCEDEAMKVRMAQDELEVLVADRDSAKHTLQIEAAKWLDLSRKAQDQKSPDDYKRELLEKSRGLDALKKEIEEEKSRNVMLRSRLKASQQAETRLKELKATIGTLKGLRASYNTEIAAQEASMRRKKTPHESFEELQSQLQEAQQRYQFLCASIDLLP